MAGIDTLAIDVSSTFMNVASDSAIVPSTSAPPVSGAAAVFIVAGPGASRAIVVAAMIDRSDASERLGCVLSGNLRVLRDELRGLAADLAALRARKLRPIELRGSGLIGGDDRLHSSIGNFV